MTEEKGLSVSRACQVARLSRAAYYKLGTNWAVRDAAVIAALNAALAERARWGFWKCYDRMRNLGHPWNHKRVHRVYCRMKLNLPRRTKRRPPQRERQPLTVVPSMNVVWALDFMRDTLYGGKVFRTLNVIDEANRGALGIDIAVSIPAVRVITFVTQLLDLHGRPQAIRCDNGPELTSEAFMDWCKSQNIEPRFIQRRKPDQNGFTSSASTGPTARRCSMPTCSTRSLKCASSPRNGSPSTTKSDRTTRWEACRQRITASACSKRKLQFRTVY